MNPIYILARARFRLIIAGRYCIRLPDLLSFKAPRVEAANSDLVMKILEMEPEIKLVIVDYDMPVLDGFQLTTLIRKKYPKEKLAIIGISAYGSNIISTQFLKMGANDFILKPFSKAEFGFRVLQNVEMLDYMDIIRKSASIDFLTGLHNRRYFFDVGEKMFANAKRENFEIIIAMLDIDNFKAINDTYGHSSGDNVLRHTDSVLSAHFRKADLVARFRGDEFCIIAVNLKERNADWKFEKLKRS
jgi:PleD family two-component response regulator